MSKRTIKRITLIILTGVAVASVWPSAPVVATVLGHGLALDSIVGVVAGVYLTTK